MKLCRKIINALKNFNLNILIILGLLLHLQISPILAQTESPWYMPEPAEHQAALEQCREGNVGLECTVQAIVVAIQNSIGENIDPQPEPSETEGGRKPGVMHFASSMVNMLISRPPIYVSDYTDYVAYKINPISPVYAQQGTGFRALSSLIKIWTAFRNIAYLAFVLIFIAIGFLIMFRAQINPQTVVNIQNSLPKLVVTLLLITFSYAIAGFLVDLIYLGIYLMISTFATQGLINNPDVVREAFLSENIFTMANKAGFYRHSDKIVDAIDIILKESFSDLVNSLYIVFSIGGSLTWVIVSVAIVFSIFKIFFQLLIAYVNIIISTMLAPIMILFNAMPGSTSFSNWLRNFLSNVLIFPVVALIFMVSAILIGRPADASEPDDWQIQTGLFEQGEPWTPPFIAIERSVEDVMTLIGLGFLLITPQMITLVQQSLKAKPLPISGVFAPIAVGARAAGVAVSPITSVVRGAGSMVRTAAGGAISQYGENILGEVTRRRQK